MALKPFVGPWSQFQFLDLFTQSVELLGRDINRSLGRYLDTGEHKYRINAHRRPCLTWDSNPRFQCLSGRRQFMLYTARSLWSVIYSTLHFTYPPKILSVVTFLTWETETKDFSLARDLLYNLTLVHVNNWNVVGAEISQLSTQMALVYTHYDNFF
jgi:hypothetical protein